VPKKGRQFEIVKETAYKLILSIHIVFFFLLDLSFVPSAVSAVIKAELSLLV
jgi:hypothetical protein